MDNQIITGFKGRTLQIGDLVKVHRNLNNGLWSVTAKTGKFKNKVVHHCAHISISDVSFVISQAGRNRVLKEGRKNVHAWCVGVITSLSDNGLKTGCANAQPYALKKGQSAHYLFGIE